MGDTAEDFPYVSRLADEGSSAAQERNVVSSRDEAVERVTAASGSVDVGAGGRVGPISIGAPQAKPEVVGDGKSDAGVVVIDVVDEAVAAKAGLEKVAFTAVPDEVALRSGGSVQLSIDYSGFRDAYGADWAGRLQLVQFDACWLARPGASDCAGPVVVPGVVNDVAAGVISVEVKASDLNGLLPSGAGRSFRAATGGPGWGLSAGAYSYSGNYATTSLNPSGEWSAGGNSGAFNWTYPIEGMGSPAGDAPTVNLSYNSGALDGMSSDQNNQGGLLSSGWSMGDAFIERQWKSCFTDGGGTGDLCHVGMNATISLVGASGRLLLESTTAGPNGYTIYTYRIEQDNNWKVMLYSKSTSAVRGGFEDDSLDSYWVVQDLAGNQYWFGFGKSEGNAGDLPGTELHSSWTVPVRSLQSGEPCYGQSGKWCHQTYRWMLDRIVDPNGVVTTYHYTVDKNHYGRLGQPANPTPYVSGGVLDRIEYGQLLTTAGDAGVETGRIEFDYQYRCDNVADCWTPPTPTTGADFPDIPVDQFCDLNGSSTWCTKYAPTFFLLHRLQSVTPQRRTGSSMLGWPIVHRLTYNWVDADGAGADPVRMWLRTIQRQETTSSTFFQAIRFDSFNSNLENRVDHNVAGGVTAMKMYRIDEIVDDMGRVIKVTYSPKDTTCPSSGWSTNKARCYARWFTPVPAPGADPGFAKWNKYRVDRVEVRDGLGASTATVYSYDYLEPSEDPVHGGVAWHADMDPFQDDDKKSWGEYRGYFQVAVIVGETTGPNADPNRSVTVQRFYRGMDQDLTTHGNPAAPKKNVSVPVKAGTLYVDHDWLAGKELESWTTNATGSTEYSGAVTLYTTWPVTTTDGTARQVAVSEILGREQGPHYTRQQNNYDGLRRLSTSVFYGNVNSTWTTNLNGPSTRLSPSGTPDDLCTKYEYSTPTSFSATQPGFLVGLATRVSTFAATDCTGTALTRIDNTYDTYGRLTTVETYDSSGTVYPINGTTPLTKVTGTTSYENNGFQTPIGWGRQKVVTDEMGISTTLQYKSWADTGTPAALTAAGNHNLERVTLETRGAGQATIYATSSINYDLLGRDAYTTDANGRITRPCFDEWSRVTAVYLPGDAFTTCGAGNPSMTTVFSPTSVTVQNANLNVYGYPIQAWRIQSRQLFSVPGDAWHPTDAGANAVYLETFTYVDSMGRTLETQTASPSGGRIVTRGTFNSRGLPERTSAQFHTGGAPGSGRVNAANTAVPIDTVTTYDPLGRPTSTALVNNGTTTLRTSTTTYNGRTTTAKPAIAPGGSTQYHSTHTTTDAWGRVHSVTVGGALTEFEYTTKGEQQRIIYPTVGAEPTVATSFTYNQLGMVTGINEPNAGASTLTLYANGAQRTSTDAKNQTILATLDAQGRVSAVRNGNARDGSGNPTSPLLSTYTYDPTIPVGGGAPVTQIGLPGTVTTYWQPDLSSNTTEVALTATTAGVDSQGRTTHYQLQAQPSIASTSPLYNNPGTTSDGDLFAAHTFTTSYTRNNLVWQETIPGAGGVAPETLTTTFTTLGLSDRVVSGTNPWVNLTAYDALGRVTGMELRDATSSGAAGLDLGWLYRSDDGRLDSQTATINGGPTNGMRIQRDTYTYDPSGNITNIVHDPDQLTGYTGPGTGTVTTEQIVNDERECFYYDVYDRLIDAYTQGRTDPLVGHPGCIAAPNTPPTPTGPAPYRETNTHDHQTRFVSHAGRTYSYTNPTSSGAPTAPTGCSAGTNPDKPHALKATTGGTPASEWFWYDCNGSLTQRVENPGTPSAVTWTHGWNTLGKLQTTQSSADGAPSTNIYDASGGRFLRQDPDGTRTLYLGQLELRHQGTQLQVAKYYPGGTQRDFDGTTTFTTTNHQGTLTATVTAAGAYEYLRYTPYGDDRSGTPPNDKAFLGETIDPAQALTYLNARSTNTSNGMFIAVDPAVAKTRDPYVYASGNPIRRSDPTGLFDLNPFDDIADAVGDVVDTVGDAVEATVEWVGDRVEDGAVAVAREILGGLGQFVDGAIDGLIDNFDILGMADAAISVIKGGVSGVVDTIKGLASLGLDDLLLMLADSIIPVDDCKANGVAWCAGYFVASTLGGAAGKLDEIGDTLKAFKKRKNSLDNDSGSGGSSSVCPARMSFSGDTNVLMADGTVKPIKDIQIGDVVYALDPQTGQAGPRAVTAIWVHLDTLVDLTTSNGNITTTEDHPFWNATDLEWQDAQDLDNGDQLQGVGDVTVVVHGIDAQSTQSALAYNLTVDDLHTYFVADTSGTAVLVHNTDCGGEAGATNTAGAGPRVGGGASLDNLTPGEMTRIQNAANKVDQPISVVGSRASGTAGPYSDWDYVVPGANSSTVGKIKNSLPEGSRGIGDPRNIDIFRGQVNEDLPFITFNPTPR